MIGVQSLVETGKVLSQEVGDHLPAIVGTILLPSTIGTALGIEHHRKSLFKVGVSSVGGKGISIQAYDNQGIIGDDRGEIGSESIRVEVDRFVFQIGKSDIFLLVVQQRGGVGAAIYRAGSLYL